MVRPIAGAIGRTWGEVASAAADLSGWATTSGENHECDAHAGSREPRGGGKTFTVTIGRLSGEASGGKLLIGV